MQFHLSKLGAENKIIKAYNEDGKTRNYISEDNIISEVHGSIGSLSILA